MTVFRIVPIDKDAESIVGGGADYTEPDSGSQERDCEEEIAGEICAGWDAMRRVEGGEDVGDIPEDGERELMLELGIRLEVL